MLWEAPLAWASQVALVVKSPSANAGEARDVGSIPGLGRSPGGVNGNPPQSSCLENPMTEEPGGLQSMVAKSQTFWTLSEPLKVK